MNLKPVESCAFLFCILLVLFKENYFFRFENILRLILLRREEINLSLRVLVGFDLNFLLAFINCNQIVVPLN